VIPSGQIASIWQLAREALRHWIMKEYSIEKVRKFMGKINNGFDYWFTFVINPGVEPTNNRAERALRPHVVLRKILGTLRNDKGTSIHQSGYSSPLAACTDSLSLVRSRAPLVVIEPSGFLFAAL